MHEFSICQSLVESILSELGKINPAPKRLLKAYVVIGQLRQIVPDYLQFAYQTLIPNTAADHSELVVRLVPIAVTCQACGWTGAISPPLFICDACQTADVVVKNGMELYLENLEIEVDDAAGN